MRKPNAANVGRHRAVLLRDKEIRRLYQGETAQSLAERFGISRQRVYQIVGTRRKPSSCHKMPTPPKDRGHYIRHYSHYPKKARVNSKWSKFNKNLRLEVDEFTCQSCRTTENLDVHHIDRKGPHKTQSPNNDLSNLITLCHRCHLRLHYGIGEREDDILQRHEAGETLQNIGDSYGLSRQRILQIIQAYKKFLEINMAKA